MSSQSEQTPGPLPEDAVLVHIGPYKTGTTAIQSSLHEHRDELAAAGVTYPGSTIRQMRPSWALLGRSRVGEVDEPMAAWDDLVAEVRRAPGRVVVSSEDFASARVEHVARLVDDLGPDRVHMLVVARRLDKLLPSAWQERVKSVGETRTYEQWLREVLAEERVGPAAGAFWHNHGLSGIVDRWRTSLPAARIVVLVTDEADRSLAPRTFERLLKLDEGLLAPGKFQNTSLSMERIELCRQVNLAVEGRGWVGNRRLNTTRRHVLPGLRDAPRTDWESPIPPLPEWTVERLSALSDERADGVVKAGVRVVGDPDRLRWHGEGASGELAAPPATMPTEAAAAALAGAFAGTLKSLRRQAAEAPPPAKPPARVPTHEALAGASGRELVRELARRVRRRVLPGGR